MSDATLSRTEEVRRLERAATDELEKIPGVLAAAVWLRDTDRVREVYITGAPGASIASLQRTAAEVLARCSLDAAAGALHVAVLDEFSTPLPLWRGRSLLLDGIEVARADHFVTCRVRLLRRGTPFSGEARELDTELGRARAAARATLGAAEQATRGIRLGLEGIHLLESFGRRYLMLSVEAAFARRSASLPGINALDRSIEDAACLAVLSAVERWLFW